MQCDFHSYSVPDRGAEYCDDRVCVFVHDHSCITARPIYTKFVVLVTCGCGFVLLWQHSDTPVHYVLPLLWMMSYLHINQGCSMSPASWITAHMQPWAWLQMAHRNEYLLWAADAQDYFSRSGFTRPQWVCWIFMTSCLHIMSLRIQQHENDVLKVTPQVAALGAESAVYDCLVFFRH